MTDQNQPEFDAIRYEIEGSPTPAPIDPVQGVADAANAGEGEPFTTAAQHLVASGHLRVADGFFTLA